MVIYMMMYPTTIVRLGVIVFLWDTISVKCSSEYVIYVSIKNETKTAIHP